MQDLGPGDGPGVQQVVEYEYTLVPDDDGWAVYDLVSVE